MIDKNKSYPIDEAIELLKKTSFVKFNPSVDVHINVTDKGLRGVVTLPHGSGKTKKILVISSKNAKEEIKKIEGGKLEFDILIATPDVMPELAKVAKILGPRGLMPNPKSGTVTDETEKTVQKLEGGFLEFKTEMNAPLIHQPIGRLSFTSEQIKDNFQVLITAVSRKNIQKITLTTSMGPGIKIDSSTL